MGETPPGRSAGPLGHNVSLQERAYRIRRNTLRIGAVQGEGRRAEDYSQLIAAYRGLSRAASES